MKTAKQNLPGLAVLIAALLLIGVAIAAVENPAARPVEYCEMHEIYKRTGGE